MVCNQYKLEFSNSQINVKYISTQIIFALKMKYCNKKSAKTLNGCEEIKLQSVLKTN